MAGSRIFLFVLVVLLSAPYAVPAQASNEAVALTPNVVLAGSPELIRVSAPGAKAVEGVWLGRDVEFFRSADRGVWIALAGVDVEAAVGPSELHITAHGEGKDIDLSRTIEIHAAHYRTGALTVSPKFVQPPPEALEEINAESKIKERIFSASADKPLWSGSFHAPVASAATDSFGTRRMFNGKLASIHKGADFRAAAGTPVHASNSGVVVLARPLYYEGNCVIIDHGMGLFTLSMHFSRIDVHEGQHVKAGDRLGLSGATGRVTGPHLHWAVRWQGAYLDPVKLLRLNLDAVRSPVTR
jgi:murein DD-endopeptidase MepM/ murein hydrolase activator NlpD